jgi:aspartate racemase
MSVKSDASEQRSQLSAAKRALLEKRLRGGLEGKTAEPVIKPRSQAVAPALSFAQERLWFLDQLEPDSPLYNNAFAFRINGTLSEDALQQTFEAIVSRHDSLRTTFSDVEGVPAQCIAEKGTVIIPVSDLTSLPKEEREDEARRLAAEEFRRPFDLVKGPLLRVNLLRLDPTEHILLLTLHHIITDGWSTGVLLQEMGAHYDAFAQGAVPSLPPLPIQYADFAEWQREWLQGEVLASQISYWKEQLGGNLPVLTLPTDHPRPAVQSYRGKSKTYVIRKALFEELKVLSQREGVTLFMTLLAAFQTLLHRYTGQDDIIIGSPIANRDHQETEGLIGFFVNTLVLRTDLSGNPAFRDLMIRVREMALGAYAYQNLPFEKLVKELNVPRNLSFNPLFQVMLVFQNGTREPVPFSGLMLTPLEAETGTAKFDLTLDLIEGLEGLACTIEYATDLFDDPTIERMFSHFQTLLQGIVTNPDARLSELPLLTAFENHQILIEWNATQTDFPRDKCIHELFEEQVLRTPAAIALIFEDQRLTYEELNRKANQLANYLRKLGVGPEILVGICMERSLAMVVGLLGILKAGGAYMPLDPAYPKERLSFMLEDAGISVLLTQHRLIPAIPECTLRILCLDEDCEAVTRENDRNVSTASTSDTLAYVMYTSGSTGTPKGVEVLHRCVVRLVVRTGYARLNAKEIFLQLAPISFDASTFELWAALLNGATCIVYTPAALSTVKLAEHIRRHSVSTLWLTSSLFNTVIDEDPQALRGISQLLIGGEQLSAPHVRRAQEELSGVQIINGYGPTENTTFTCCYSIPQGLAKDTTTIPIGRPIANTDVYILDQYLQLVPVGVPGELYTGGDGLARGYLKRPDLTEEKFISHPFSSDPDARLYKTGDLVRYCSDGNIEFLGRIDHQVKIRGFRIELGEIESALGGHETAREVVVMAREDVPGDKRLVAYIIPEVGQKPSITMLRQYLKEKLPEYMVPNAFVMLEKFPLTPSGKVDRRALPAPEQMRPELEKTYVAPQTPVEQSLAVFWSEVLGVERVGVNDNFFELGGTSLLAVRLFVRIRKWAGIDLPLATLFSSPTVRELAELLDPGCAAAPNFGDNASEISSPVQQWRSLVPMQPKGNRPPFFVIHAVGGNVLNYLTLLPHLGPDQPVYGLQARGLDGVQSSFSSIEEMAGHYIDEIRSVQSFGPYFLGGASFGGTAALEIAQQLLRQGEKVALLALFDSIGPGEHGYQYWRSSLKMRLAGIKAEAKSNNTSLPLFLSKRIARYFSNRIRKFRLRIFRLTDRPIPLELRDEYLFTNHNTILKSYVPQPYHGPITLFRGPAEDRWPYNDPELGWKNISKGGLKTIIIHAHHLEFMEPPELGIRFANELREAQDRPNDHD